MKKLSKKRIFIWCCVGAILVGFVSMGFFTWRNIKTSPQYSLIQMYKAVQKADYERFSQYIDLEAIMNSLFSEISQAFNPILSTETELTGSKLFTLDQATKEFIQQELKTQIEKGEFMGLENPRISSVKDVFVTWNAINIKMVDKIAHVTIPNGKDKEITFHMKQKGPIWQIIALETDENSLQNYIDPSGSLQESTSETTQLEKFASLKVKGKGAIDADKLSEGIPLLEEALKIQYDQEVTDWLNEAYFERAEYYYSIGDKEKAIEDLSKIYPITSKAEELLRQMEEN